MIWIFGFSILPWYSTENIKYLNHLPPLGHTVRLHGTYRTHTCEGPAYVKIAIQVTDDNNEKLTCAGVIHEIIMVDEMDK